MTSPHTPLPYYAILLAAGNGSRFDPLGHQNKLLQPLDDGCSVAVTSAANLLAIMPHVLAVVRPGTKELQAELKAIGCELGQGHLLAGPVDADGAALLLAHGPRAVA